MSIAGTGAAEGDVLQLRNGGGGILGQVTLNAAHLTAQQVVITPPLAAGSTYDLNALLIDRAGNVSPASTSHAVTVDTSLATVTTVALTSATGAQNNFLNVNDTVTATVTFDKIVHVDTNGGTPTLALNIGGTVVQAQYVEGSGTRNLRFRTAIAVDRADADGIAIGENAIVLNGATIRNNTGEDAVLAHVAVGANGSYRVDTTAPGAPTIAAVFDDVGLVTAEVVNGGSTDDAQPVLRVSLAGAGAAVGDTLRVFSGTAMLGSPVTLTQADIDAGYRDVETPVLSDGATYSLKVQLTDLAGNLGADSTSFTLSVDTTTASLAPGAIALTAATGALDSRLNAGDTLTATATFDDAVFVTGAPTLALNIGGTIVQATYVEGSGTKSLRFRTTITSGRNDADGVAIDANPISLNGGTIRTAAGEDAALSYAGGTAANPNYLVDTVAPGAPVVVSVNDAFGATQGSVANGGYTDDPRPQVRVEFAPSAGAAEGDVLRLRNGSVVLTEAVLTAADIAAGFRVIQTPTLTNGTTYNLNALLTDRAGNVGAPSANFTVTSDSTVAGVSSVALSSATNAQNGRLNLGDTVTARVNFNEAVFVVVGASAPTLKLTIGGTLVDAVYTGGTGTAALSFAYTIAAGLNDGDGISIGADALLPNGGTIRNQAGGDALLTHNAVADNASFRVDTAVPTAPTITVRDDVGPVTGSVSSGSRTDDLQPAVRVTTTGTGAEAGDVLRLRNFGNDFGTLVTLTEDDIAAGFRDVLTPVLSDATTYDFTVLIIDQAGNVGASSPSRSVTTDATAALVSTLGLTSSTGAQNSRLNAGDTVTATVTFNETVTVTGSPVLKMRIGDDLVDAAFQSLTGGTAMTFQYTVQAGQTAALGIAFDADPIQLNGGAIRNLAGSDAVLSRAALAGNTSYLVDAVAPTVQITDDEPGTGNIDGGSITYTFTFSEAVTGFDNNDVVVTGGTKGSFAGSGAVYTLVVTPTPGLQGDITVNVAAGAAFDLAGNASTAAAPSVQAVDMQAPTITLSGVDISADTGSSASDFITSTQAQTITATLSAALAAGDVLLGSLDAGATWTDITARASGTALAWTGATLLSGSGRGIVFKVRDAQGNEGALTGSQAYTLDATAPTVVITDDEPATTADVTGGDIVYTFTFSEAVSGFSAADVNLAGGAKGTFTAVSTTVYTLVVTPTANVQGNVTVSVDTGAASDAAGNASVAAAASPQAVDMRTSPFQGTPGNDNLEGTPNAEVIAGGAGDDYFDGNGGADVMYGGTGNDRFLLDANQITSLSGPGAAGRIDGGAGLDTLEVWGSGVALDFTNIDAGVVRDIEKIHLGNAGGPLKITADDVLGLAGMTWNVDGNPSTVDALGQVMVTGDGTHQVQLADTGWAQTGTYSESGTTYQVWTDEAQKAQLLVGPGVSVSVLP